MPPKGPQLLLVHGFKIRLDLSVRLMTSGKKLIRIGSRLIEVPTGEATEKKSKEAPRPVPSPPSVDPVETPAPKPVNEAPVAPPVEAVEEAPKKRRGRRKKTDD